MALGRLPTVAVARKEDAEHAARKELPPPKITTLGTARAMRDVIRYECRSGKPGDEHVPAATTQTTETACVACMYVAASSSVTRESLASSTPHDTTERLSI